MFNDQVGSRADPLEEPSFSTVGKGELNPNLLFKVNILMYLRDYNI